MGNYGEWSNGKVKIDKNTPIFVCLFISINKDNKHLKDFKERRVSFVTTKTPEELKNEFLSFVKNGIVGEMSRFYYSVNPRSNEKTQRGLIHKLIDNEFNIATIPERIAAIAAQKENAYDTKKSNWLFDFDLEESVDNNILLDNFINDVVETINDKYTNKEVLRKEECLRLHKTPNGYAVISFYRFDTRGLLVKYPNVSLKRDDLLCVSWENNNEK